jgi:hypothetical protein
MLKSSPRPDARSRGRSRRKIAFVCHIDT